MSAPITVNLGTVRTDFDDAFDLARRALDAVECDRVTFVYDGARVFVDTYTVASEAFEQVRPLTDIDTDTDGHLPPVLTLRCPHCGGQVEPVLEYTGYAYSEHRDWAATQCDDCLARWDHDGDPTHGPHRATLSLTLDYRARVAALSTDTGVEA